MSRAMLMDWRFRPIRPTSGLGILTLIFLVLVGCSDSSDNRVNQVADQFSYSVLTSTTGNGLDLLDELSNSVLPELESEGAEEYAIWSRAPDPQNDFEEIAEDRLVVMLRWEDVKIQQLSDVLQGMSNVSEVSTTLWEVSLRGGEGPIQTGSGFYIHRFNRYLSEDVDEVLSLSEEAWVTWEPYWGAVVPGVWQELDPVDNVNGITRLMRIAWYRDMEHWMETRQFWKEPESFELFIERGALHLDDESWSADLAPD